MPFKAPEIERCPACSKPVYPAEAKLAAGAKFHSGCFKCSTCNKFLDSTNVGENGGKLFCKQCYGKGFGPAGYGFGGGASGLGTDGSSSNVKSVTPTTIGGAVVEGGCPRCGKRVYDAEKKVGAGRDWHKTCFNCKQCHKALDSSMLNENEGEIYCKNCYAKSFGPHGKI